MMTRRKIFEVRVTLPITADLLALVDDALEPDEYRVDFIRDAIKRELARRRRCNGEVTTRLFFSNGKKIFGTTERKNRTY